MSAADEDNATAFGLHQNSNLEIEYDHEEDDNVAFTIVYCVFMLLIILGNGMILVVILWRKELKTPRIVYIVSLITSGRQESLHRCKNEVFKDTRARINNACARAYTHKDTYIYIRKQSESER